MTAIALPIYMWIFVILLYLRISYVIGLEVQVTILFVPRLCRSKFSFCIHYIEVELVLSTQVPTFKRKLVFYPYC